FKLGGLVRAHLAGDVGPNSQWICPGRQTPAFGFSAIMEEVPFGMNRHVSRCSRRPVSRWGSVALREICPVVESNQCLRTGHITCSMFRSECNQPGARFNLHKT